MPSGLCVAVLRDVGGVIGLRECRKRSSETVRRRAAGRPAWQSDHDPRASIGTEDYAGLIRDGRVRAMG